VNPEEIVIRKCATLDEMRTCVQLQQEIWNFSDRDLIPLRIFVIAEKIGGQAIGAFLKHDLIGFALAIPGFRGGRPYLHSQMLAVHEDFRNAGLGRRIKLVQRDEAISRGFELMEWTFDPLEIKNSYLNIERLGAVARRYNLDQYGLTTSTLQGGLPTDRLVAEWWLKSSRVRQLLDQGRLPPGDIDCSIAVPAEIYRWKAVPETRGRAAKVQEANRELFVRAFAKGLAVVGYNRDAAGNGTFLLGSWQEGGS
jgi:predicted GNAT superfamily acetyltransferase